MSALCRPAGHTVFHGAAMSRYLLVCRTPQNILTTTCRVRSASASTPTALRAVKGVIRTPPSPSPALAARHPGQRKRQAPARREPAARLFLSLSAVARAAPLGELRGSGLRVGPPPRLREAAPSGEAGVLLICSLFSRRDTQHRDAGKSACGSPRDPTEPPCSHDCSCPSKVARHRSPRTERESHEEQGHPPGPREASCRCYGQTARFVKRFRQEGYEKLSISPSRFPFRIVPITAAKPNL